MSDSPSPPPIMRGRAGQAWAVDIARAYQRAGIPADKITCVMQWVVEAKWAHPIFPHYWITLVHLRPVRGVPEAKIVLPGATHELIIFSIDPKFPVGPMILGEGVKYLNPPNFVGQFIADHDAAAVGRVEGSVQAICDGVLSPDSDFRSAWAALYGDSALKA